MTTPPGPPVDTVTVTSTGPAARGEVDGFAQAVGSTVTVVTSRQSPQTKVHLIGIAFTSALTIAGLLGLWDRLGMTADQVGVLLTTAGVLVTTLAHIMLGTTPKVPE